MQHGTAGHLHVGHLADRGIGSHHHVLQVGQRPVVGDRVQATGDRIHLGMGGVAVGQRAAEVRVLDGVELAAQLHRTRTGLHQRERATTDADDVGVGRLHPAVALTRHRNLVECL